MNALATLTSALLSMPIVFMQTMARKTRTKRGEFFADHLPFVDLYGFLAVIMFCEAALMASHEYHEGQETERGRYCRSRDDPRPRGCSRIQRRAPAHEFDDADASELAPNWSALRSNMPADKRKGYKSQQSEHQHHGRWNTPCHRFLAFTAGAMAMVAENAVYRHPRLRDRRLAPETCRAFCTATSWSRPSRTERPR